MLVRTFLAVLVASATFANASQLPVPPDLAKPGKYQSNEEVLRLDAPPREAWAFWMETNIIDFLEPTERIPAIASIDVIRGPWGEPGSVRRVTFDDGGSALERVLTATATEFTYQIWNIETGSGRFIDHIYGEMRARPAGDGTEIVWRYNIKPSVFFARPFIRSFLNNDFDPFMEGGMAGMAAAFEEWSTR